ncbi:SubName: Full=Uncharacterized protein {ECO:0000313/EMBL:CCA71440.1} [Serendipita indica DSM 11827]|uniref:Uncharacterized protein n=1 Tax=Serendipita indica (strain DSM 11827) TaxID=1109443 RepID=G4TJE3_SERID|nr:SubName: Full=Uncharacterized protein {ECO:0000313/EMBL:CCA71440.1} [Serendipita indica DSM 11827]CCA71440.1 hypothetical protein PIIN_05379 [Serendipita indica DSM 11827]
MSRPLKHNSKQLRWIALGGALSYYTDVVALLRNLVRPPSSGDTLEDGEGWTWSRMSAVASVGLGSLTILLFLYLLLLPKLSGRRLEYSQWRNSEQLRIVIPILTVTIFSGWTFLVFALYASSLGFLLSFLGASGLYILSFGLLGLIPIARL